MEENNSNSSRGVNYLFLIWLVIFVAKVTGHIDWSWWIIFLPLSPFILVLGAFCVAICFIIISCIVVGIGFILYLIYESIKERF